MWREGKTMPQQKFRLIGPPPSLILPAARAQLCLGKQFVNSITRKSGMPDGIFDSDVR